MAEFHLAVFNHQTRAAVLAQSVAALEMPSAELMRTATGKPFLESPNGKTHGLSIAHIRKASPPFSLMASSVTSNIGIDAEVFPHGQGDSVFRNSIVAPAEIELAKALSEQQLDAGLFLWVVKEAALKAGGTVMVDPRDVLITPIGQNLARAESWYLPQAAVLAFHTFTAPHSANRILLAAAVADIIQPVAIHHGGQLPNFIPLNLD